MFRLCAIRPAGACGERTVAPKQALWQFELDFICDTYPCFLLRPARLTPRDWSIPRCRNDDGLVDELVANESWRDLCTEMISHDMNQGWRGEAHRARKQRPQGTSMHAATLFSWLVSWLPCGPYWRDSLISGSLGA
jgi:hypothetical protein